MDKQGHSQKQRRAQNESIFREHNEQIGHMVSPLLDPKSKSELAVQFVCECSDEDCMEPVSIPLIEYKLVRQNKLQFIIRPGHQQADIERVVKSYSYYIVEKNIEPPPSDGELNAT